MKFQYSEKKVKLPEKVHAYAEKKVMKLARFFEDDAEALIVFSVEKNRNKAELTVHGAGTWFRASESTSDMFASIDAAIGTIEGQIRKNKTKLEKRMRSAAFDELNDGADVADEKEYDLVRTKHVAVKPQTVDEAILQMNMLGHEFYMFINEATGLVSVVYCRTDGGYGLLEPSAE